MLPLNTGSDLLFFLISEFDEPNAGRLYEYLRSPSDRAKLMEGVMLGRKDYDEWAKSQGMMIARRWRECFCSPALREALSEMTSRMQSALLEQRRD